MATKLPSFEYDGKLWTVDLRLREFRLFVFGEIPEFVQFDSPQGLKLLAAYASKSRG